MFDNREIIEFCDVVTYFAEKQYQNDEEKNEFFNSFISRVVLFDDCIYIFYNTSLNMPTKVKLDKSDLAELREYRTNKKSTQFQPLGFKLGACGGTDLNPIEHLIFWTFNIYVVYINLQNIFQSESEKVHNLCLGQF